MFLRSIKIQSACDTFENDGESRGDDGVVRSHVELWCYT